MTRFDERDLRRVAQITRRRLTETARMRRARDRDRDRYLTSLDARISRCPGCGDWVWMSRPCTACQAMSAQRAADFLASRWAS